MFDMLVRFFSKKYVRSVLIVAAATMSSSLCSQENVEDDSISLLFSSIKRHNISAVKKIVSRHPSIIHRDLNGTFPLHAAAYAGHVDMIAFLVEQGAEVNVLDWKGFTPLHDAAYFAHTDAMRYLLDHGAAVNARTMRGQTPLLLATYNNKGVDVLQVLHEYGANMNAKIDKGWTVLHEVIFRSRVDQILFLIDHGAEMNIQNDDQKTPFDFLVNPWAREAWHFEVLHSIIERAASVDAETDSGSSILCRMMHSAPSGYIPHVDRGKTIEHLLSQYSQISDRERQQLVAHYEERYRYWLQQRRQKLHQAVQGLKVPNDLKRYLIDFVAEKTR